MRWIVAGAVALSMMASTNAFAQSSAVDDTMAVCTSVIAEQYESSEDPLPRWLECVGAVEGFLAVVGAVGPSADPLIGELVAALAELYRDDDQCKIRETELPLAIATAAGGVFEEVIKAEYVLIGEQITDCDIGGTAAIVVTPASDA